MLPANLRAPVRVPAMQLQLIRVLVMQVLTHVVEQSQRCKGHGEQLSNHKRFQSLLTEAGFNLARKGFVSHYQPAVPVTSLPSCTVLTPFLKITDELFSPCNKSLLHCKAGCSPLLSKVVLQPVPRSTGRSRQEQHYPKPCT